MGRNLRFIAASGLLAAGVWAAVPATAEQGVRACTATELKASELVDGHLAFSTFEGNERTVGALRAHTSYGFEVTPSGYVIADTIRVTGPHGALGKIAGARAVTFRLATESPGALPVTIAWEQEVVDANGIPTTERCSASGSATLTVRSQSPVRLTAAAKRASLEVTVRPGRAPASRGAVTYEFRVRRGNASAPSLRTAPIARHRYAADVLGPESKSEVHSVRGVGQFLVLPGVRGVNLHGRMLLSPGTVPAGQKRKFGFSIRVLQGGKVAGGVRGGMVCRGATRSSLRCTQTTLVGQP
jgi:hypothetical protein